MPVGVLFRLETAQELETKAAALTGSSQGFQLLRYGQYSVRDLHGNASPYCALIVLPSGTALDGFGWNVSTESCTNATEAYVFDSYFPQAMYLDRRVKLFKTLSLYDPKLLLVDYNPYSPAAELGDPTQSLKVRSDSQPGISEKTMAVTFKPDPSKDMLPGPLRWNLSALQGYGYRLGMTLGLGSSVQRPSMNAPWAPELSHITHSDAGCVAPRCAFLEVGTAVIAAWKTDFGLGYLKENSAYKYALFDSLITLKSQSISPDGLLTCCQPGELLKCGGHGAEAALFAKMVLEGVTSSSYLVATACPDRGCPFVTLTSDVLNCTNWNRSRFGFPHALEKGKKQGPSTQPQEGLIRDVRWNNLDIGMGSGLDRFEGDGLLPAYAVEDALEEICDGANSILSTQLALALVAADSTKSVSGALLDLSVTVVAIVAMGSGRMDLQHWLHKVLALAASRGRPAPPAWVTPLAKVCTCFIIGLTVIVAPVATLAADVVARNNNPKGDLDSTSTGWVSANTGFGKGPYYVTAVVTTTITFEGNPGAFALVIVNCVVAGLGAFLLCFRVFKS